MGEFGNLQRWDRQASNPAQPRGMRQAGQAAQGYERSVRGGGDGGEFGNLGQFTSQRGYVGQAQSWYTGANQGGTENGWDTGFWKRAMEQQERLAEQGRLSQQFETKHATGVVTWDHTSEDGNTRFHFGDVYDNGKKQGNVFHQFDRGTANLMMADLVFDADTKAHIYRENDPRKALDKAIRGERHDRNVRIPQENAARDFQADVVQRADTIEGGKGEAAIIGGAVTGGGALGAGIGTIIAPGLGTLIGGGIGGAIGGVSAWLNQDSLNEQAARAIEITNASVDETNRVAAGGTFVNQWSGFAGKLIVPFGNTIQGFADASQGKMGDGKSEFYRVDKHGDRTVSKAFRVADVVGAVADAALQFSNPIGLGLYTTTMSGTILGETTELAFSGGKSFDYSRGGFDNIFTDEEGKFDLSAAGAGIGKIGIDVLQLGMTKGLAGKVDATRLASGQEKAFSGKYFGGRLPGFQQRVAGLKERGAEKIGRGLTTEQKAAVASGGRVEEAAGRRFVLNDEGKVVGKSQATMALLAPSEAISALSTRVLAMRGASKAKGAYSADDFYRAADAMAKGERKLTTAIVNGFGEGTEEVIQAVLEPHSHGQAISSTEVINAGLYGFAMGAGMGLGMNTRMPTADQKMSEMARAAYINRTGEKVSRRDWSKQWESASATQKATLTAMGSMESATMKAALKNIQDNQAKDMVSGVVGAQRLADAIQTELKKNLANATDRTDGAFVVVQTEDAGEIDEDGNIQPWSQPTDAVVGSARQTAVNLSQHLRGIGHQITTMKKDVEFWDKKVAKEPTNPEYLRSQAQNTADIAAAERVLELGAVLEKQMHDSAVYIDDETRTEPEIRAEVMLMNQRLADAFHQRDTSLPEEDRLALSRAAFALVARDPHDHAGSYQFLLPQVSQRLTMNGAHNLLQISHAVLSPLGADYDGDKVRLLNQLILNDDVYMRARSGSHFLGAGASVNIKAPAYEKWILEDMTSAVNSTNDAMRNFASGKLTEIGTIIRRRYTEDKAGNPILDDEGNVVIGEETMDAILEAFYENVHHGNPESRQTLLDDIARAAGGRITAYAQAHLSNEWLWIDQVVRSTMQRFQEGYAAHNPSPGPMTDADLASLDNVYRTPVNNMSDSIRERIATKAATAGITLNQMFPGDSLFRKFQKLHYSSYLAPVLTAEGTEDSMSVMEQVVLYEALGQGITQSELDAIGAKDDITARVLVKLERLALNAQSLHPNMSKHEARLLIANMQVLDLEVDNTGKAVPKYGKGKGGKPQTVSLTQFLLKQSLMVDRRAKDSIFEVSEELQRKHQRIEAMTRPNSRGNPAAQKALIEVFAAQQLYTLLGEEATVYGPHLTVEQWVRQYASRTEAQRRSETTALHEHPAYLGKAVAKGIPYDLRDAVDKKTGPQISAFRSLTDSMLAAGSARIALDSKGYAVGEKADQSDAVSKQWQGGFTNARAAIYKYLDLNPADNELDVETVQKMFTSHPEFAAKVFKLIPNAAVNAVLATGEDGQVYASNWVYNMFTISDPKHAEMHYWWNLLMAELNAKQVVQHHNEEGEIEGLNGIEYNSLKRRMHRVVWALAANDDSGALLQKFIERGDRATDLREFIKWVNTEAGVRGDQAPITAWVDDVSDFDLDKAGGGWTSEVTGAELREAISSLQTSATNLSKDLTDEKISLQADRITLDAIRRWHDHLNGGTGVVQQGDEQLYQQFLKRIDEAGKSYLGLGPQAMIYQTIGAVRGFNAFSHNKGVTSENTTIQGAFDAMRDSYDYVTNYERVMASMTAVNLDAVSGNLSQLAKDGLRSMDDNGKEVAWNVPGVEQWLDMLSEPGQRGLARSVLFPQVMERDFDGVMRPKMLHGKELKPLLDGSLHKQLFNDRGVIKLDPALRYISMLEAQTREYKGHYPVQRAINDIVIARTSAADHVLSTDELEDLVLKTYHEVARNIQAFASIEANRFNPKTRQLKDPTAESPLVALMADTKAAQRMVALGRRLRLNAADQPLTDVALKQLIAQRKTEALAEKDNLDLTITPGMSQAEKLEVHRQMDLIDDEVTRFEEQLRLLLDDDMASTVAAMFDYNESADDLTKVDQRKKITEYVGKNLTMLESVVSSTITLRKLTSQMRDDGLRGNIKMSEAEWKELSSAVIAVHLASVAESAGANLTITPYPDEDRKDDRRYYDTSFSYLLEPLMNPEGPIIQAAKDLHWRSGRHDVVTENEDAVRLMSQTLFAEFSLGQWTADIPRLSMEANNRLDSAAAEMAIAMAGNSPKRQAVFAAALKRRFTLPHDQAHEDSLITRTTLKGLELNNHLFDEIWMELPTGRVKRPMIQLNNRFARSVNLRYKDAAGVEQTIDLLASDQNLGRPWAGGPEFDGTGYKEIHLARVRNAMARQAFDLKIRPSTMEVDIEFFHPESQPDDTGRAEGDESWHNSLLFEGTAFKLDGDQSDSLTSTQWFQNGSLSPSAQAAALQASKKGKAALQVIDTIPSGVVKNLENDWRKKFAEMLNAKTKIMLDTDLGFGRMDDEAWNATYKDMKIRHFVRGKDADGKEVVWTAEQVMNFQAQNPGVDLPLTEAELWIPTDTVLRSLLGEQGTQGVTRLFPDELEIDLARVDTYKGITQDMIDRFEGMKGGAETLENTRVANVARQSTFVVRAKLSREEKDRYDARVSFLNLLREGIAGDRSAWSGNTDRASGGFNPQTNLAAVMQTADAFLRSENISLDWAAGGVPFIAPRKPIDMALSKMLLHELEAALDKKGNRAGWIFQESPHSEQAKGILNGDVLNPGKQKGAMRVSPGDLVLVQLDTFQGDRELMEKRLQWFAERGATIVLGSSDGSNDLRAEGEVFLDQLDYGRIAGSGHVYQENNRDSRFQNVRARTSSLIETRGVSKMNRVVTFLLKNKPIAENAAWVNMKSKNLGSIKVQMNLVPTDAWGGFNVPVNEFANDDMVDRTKAHLYGLNNDDGKKLLLQQSNGHIKEGSEERDKADAEFLLRWDSLIDRLERNQGTVLPVAGEEFGTGDLIPLVDNGSPARVILYRHGMKAPKRLGKKGSIEAMMATMRPGKQEAANVAVYPYKPNPAATTHTGKVVRFNPRSGYGMAVELNIPLSVFGDKKVLQWNGMKYLLTPMPDSISLPEDGFFDQTGQGIDLLASIDDTVGKEATEGTANNHRNAFAYLGMNFMPDVMKFFGTTDENLARQLLTKIARDTKPMKIEAAHDMLNGARITKTFVELMAPSAQAFAGQLGTDWLGNLNDMSVEAQIVSAMLVYLATPGAQVDDVLRSGGFNDDTSDPQARSRLMPRLFTQVFDNAEFGSPLRVEINKRLNATFDNPKRAQGVGYRLMEDFTFITTAEDGTQMEGWLQFAEAHSSGDNPITNGMSFDENANQAVSQHSLDVAYASIGARTAYPKDIARARAWAEGEGLTKFTSGEDKVDGGAWKMLTNINASSGPVWRAPLPAEATYRVNAREEVTKARQALDRSKEHGWTEEIEADYEKRAIKIVESMGLKAKQKFLVDFWVRQMLGELGGPHEDDANRGWVSGPGAIDALDLIEYNVNNHYVPVAGGMIPMLHVHDLQHIYRANRHVARPWLLRVGQHSDVETSNWGEWVKIALGTMGKSEDLFDPAFLLATDGMMHTYQNATEQLLDLPVSIDDVVTMRLMDPETSRMLVSLDRNTDLLTEDPVVLNLHRASIDDLLGGRRGVEGLKRKYPPRHEMAKRVKRLENWRKQVDSPFPTNNSSKSFLKNGTELIDHGTTTNALMRMLVNLRVGTALINPALWVSMGPEMWWRGSLDRAANAITGQGTVGFTARRQAAFTDAAATRTQEKQKVRRAELEKQLAAATDPDEVAKISRELDKTPRVGWLESFGLTHRYTPDQLDKLTKLYTVMGQRNDFKAMVYRDLMFLRPHEPGISRMEKWLEGYARLGSRMQDPTWGMRGNTMARRYLEAAMQSIHATPTLHALTTDQLIAQLSTDPEWIRKNLPDVHLYATNAIAQIRSLKATPLSLMLRGIYEPMSDSPHMGWNLLGNLVLKIPMLFSGYAMNVATTILGLQGLSDMTAMFLHGRSKPGFIGRTQAKLAGREYDPESDDAHFDMSEIIEGIDLSRSFVRGGLTHTGLFAFGMMAGGLGLSGEDDETKKRRKMAKLQGAGFVYDPRAIENDFRNADAIYFDHLPFGIDELFQNDEEDARSMWQPSWMIKQFISPIMGMEKFFETGDFRHVTWGFQDALGSFPLINSMMWSDAVETASMLASKANDESRKGTDEGLINGMGFLTTAVGVYERMLVENAFVNSLYVGKDKYDRDPYKLPLRDSDGTIQRDIENEARSQNLSMEQYLVENRDKLTREIAGGQWKGQLYVDPETAEVKQGYISRDGKEATLHTFTESRATLATIAAIGDMLTGGPGFHDSDYFRENMVIKERTFEKPKVSAAEAKAFVLAAFQGRGGQRELSADDISSRIKADFKARGQFVDWDKVDAYAAQAVKQQGPALMSEYKEGKESLTSEGALKVFEGLSKGSVHFGEASLAGLAIPFEMREKIQDQWMKQIIQEGMDMHLSQFQATSRMKRLWYGPTSNSQVVGLGDILWSKDISYDTKLVFNQLNTTYVMGPDGRPWATGWGRADVFNSLGLKPGQTQTRADQGITGTDNRGNTTYLGGGVTGGLNTGLRSLELVDKSRYVPTDVEIGKSIEDAIKNAAKQDFTPFQPFSKSGGGFHFTPFRRFGFGHRGFGGGGFGGGGGGFSDFHPMRSFPTARAPFANEIPFINTSNPLIRRADTRRERVWSERGRLKQWQ